MNALASEVADDDGVLLQRRIHGAERSWLEYSLNEWGKWHEEHADFEGYPTQDNVHAYISGCGGGNGRDRVLCLDMPEKIAKAHLRIRRMTEEQQLAIWLFYALRMREDGTLWLLEEKLLIAKWDLGLFRKTIRSARFAYLGIPE